MKTNEHKVTNAIITLLIIFTNPISWGLATMKGFNWFISPVFNLPIINLIQSIGIYMFTYVIKNHNTFSFKEELYKDNQLSRNLTMLLVPYITLLFMYVFKFIAL